MRSGTYCMLWGFCKAELPMLKSAVVTCATILSFSASAEPVKCTITEKFICDGKDCFRVPRTTWNEIDFDASLYARCTEFGCEWHPMMTAVSGVWIIIDLPARGAFAKVSATDSRFVEVVTALDEVYVSHGLCGP